MYQLNTTALMAAIAAAATTVAAKAATQQDLPQERQITQKVQSTHAHGPAYAGRVYCVATLNQAPTSQNQKMFAEAGIKVLGFLRAGQYLISYPEHASATSLVQVGVVRTREFFASEKMSHNFIARQIPVHAVRGNMTAATVVLFNEVNKATVQENLQLQGFAFEAQKTPGNTLTIVGLTEALATLAAEPFVQSIDFISENPVNEDLTARVSTKSNVLFGAYKSQRGYNGNGVEVSMGETGDVAMHPDFKGRVFSNLINAVPSNHATMTAGILLGAGNIKEDALGIAPRATMSIYDGSNNVQLVGAGTNYLNKIAVVTNTSMGQGCNTGYTIDAFAMDQMTNNYPNVLHVFSAGNMGGSNCAYGGPIGFGTITGGFKAGKNVLTVGNLKLDGTVDSTSSKGPTKDGRIKPEVVAIGNGLTAPSGMLGYQTSTGTSAAAPTVSGIGAQLIQAYRTLNKNVDPAAALIKAIIMNTADDKGLPGPDYSYGFGAVNAWKAVEAIETKSYKEGIINATGDSMVFNIAIPANTQQTKVMLYWNDVEAQANTSKALINDLDLSASRFSYAQKFLPLVLDPAANRLTVQAAPGIDTLNNVEQIIVDAPTSGTMKLVVSGSNVALGGQKFYLTYTHISQAPRFVYPMGGETFSPFSTEDITWEAAKNAPYYQLDLSIDGGNSWTSIARNIPGTTNKFTYGFNNYNTGNIKLRLYNGTTYTYSGGFSVVEKPKGLKVDWACGDSAQISWKPQTGATGFAVYKLGDFGMDSIGTTTENRLFLNGLDAANNQYFSIRAIGNNNGMSERTDAVALFLPTAICPNATDLSVSSFLNPAYSSIATCDGNNIQVKVMVTNWGMKGMVDQAIDLLVNGSVVATDTIRTMIPSFDSIPFTFSQSINVPNNAFTISAQIHAVNDADLTNNSITKTVQLRQNPTAYLPYTETFDSQPVHTSSANTTQFTLIGDVFNEKNGSGDNVDFRIANAQTPSAFTGPLNDHTGKGNYAYLEANNAARKSAILTLPCLGLNGTNAPIVEFYYYMFGNQMGELHVDASVDGNLVRDIFLPVSSNQGNKWYVYKADLSAFKYNNVVIYIRAIAGNGDASDIAIDDIRVYDANTAPVSIITPLVPSTCTGKTLIIDNQSVNADSYQWTVTPNTVSFVNGTSSTSENPEIIFLTNGIYTIDLVATNLYGTHASSRSISVDLGKNIPLLQNFKDGLAKEWTIMNEDDAETFELEQVIGSAGFQTAVIRVDNKNAATKITSDIYYSPVVALQTVNNGKFSFDYSYAFDGSSYDTLRVELSTTCGTSWSTVWEKTGNALSTANSVNGRFIPGALADWSRQVIDLSSYVGNSVQIRLVNSSNGGQPIYLDNLYFGTAAFSYYADLQVGGIIGVTNNGAISQNDVYVTMILSNNGNVTIPAGFNVGFSVEGMVAATETVSRNIPEGDTIHYTFTTSLNNRILTGRTLPSVQVSFFVQGVTNDQNAANDTLGLTLRNSLASNNISANEMGIQVYPNPTSGIVFIRNHGAHTLDIQVMDVAGKVINKSTQMAGTTTTIDLSNENRGMYLVRVSDGMNTSTQKIIVQ
jgi:hypothetical protein